MEKKVIKNGGEGGLYKNMVENTAQSDKKNKRENAMKKRWKKC